MLIGDASQARSSMKILYDMSGIESGFPTFVIKEQIIFKPVSESKKIKYSTPKWCWNEPVNQGVYDDRAKARI